MSLSWAAHIGPRSPATFRAPATKGKRRWPQCEVEPGDPPAAVQAGATRTEGPQPGLSYGH